VYGSSAALPASVSLLMLQGGGGRYDVTSPVAYSGVSPVTHCNTLQHAATHYSALQHTAGASPVIATHCNTLRHSAMHYNALQHMASPVTHGNTLQHTSTHYNALQHTASPVILAPDAEAATTAATPLWLRCV